LFVCFDGKPRLLKPQWEGEVFWGPETSEADWFDFLEREVQGLLVGGENI